MQTVSFETVCMKFQTLFSGNFKPYFLIMPSAEIFTLHAKYYVSFSQGMSHLIIYCDMIAQ